MLFKRNKIFALLLVIFIFSTYSASAQKGFRLGFGGGVGLMNSKSTDLVDTAQTKTYIGPAAWVLTQYGLTNSFALSIRAGLMTQGSKLASDSLGSSLNIKRYYWTSDIGVTFKQKIGTETIVRENFGFTLSADLTKNDSISKASEFSNSNYFVSDVRQKVFMPAFHLGVEVGKLNLNGDLFTVGVNYKQAFGISSNVNIYEGTKKIKGFVRKGSFLSISVNYYFNLSNFKKTEEFFY